MILVILGVCIAFVIVGTVLYQKSYSTELIGIVLTAIGAIPGFISMVVALFLCVGVFEVSHVDDKIAMYTEENAVIEQQIAECVERYQEYEQGVFEKVSPTDAVAFVTLYPELKSDTLVQAQIETYVENNNKIKALKEKKIDASVRKWWLYFGG